MSRLATLRTGTSVLDAEADVCVKRYGLVSAIAGGITLEMLAEAGVTDEQIGHLFGPAFDRHGNPRPGWNRMFVEDCEQGMNDVMVIVAPGNLIRDPDRYSHYVQVLFDYTAIVRIGYDFDSRLPFLELQEA